MRHGVSQLIAEIHGEGSPSELIASRIAALAQSATMILDAEQGRPWLSGGRFALSTDSAHALMQAVPGVLYELSTLTDASIGAWRACCLREGRHHHEPGVPRHVIVGAPSGTSRRMVVVLARDRAFPDGMTEVAGEFAFHLSCAARTGSVPGDAYTEISALPIMWIRDGNVLRMCTRMRCVLEEFTRPEQLRTELLLRASTASVRGPERHLARDAAGYEVAFLVLPITRVQAPRHGTATRDVLVFANVTDETLDVPMDTLRALYPLTGQQTQVAQAIINGLSADETADLLGIAANTVRTHTTALFRAIGVKSRVQLSRVLAKEVIALRAALASGLRIDVHHPRRRQV